MHKPLLIFSGALLAFAGGVDARNLALYQPATASSVLADSNYLPDRAVDGIATSNDSRWLSAAVDYPHWIEVDLGQTHALDRLRFVTGHTSQGPFPFTDFALQTWDGSAWVDLYTESASTNTGIVDTAFGPTVAGNRVRLLITGSAEDSIARLFELELYGADHGLTYVSSDPAAYGSTFDLAKPVSLTFASDIQGVDLSGVRLIQTASDTVVPGTSATVLGDTLTLSHSGLAPEAGYRVEVPAGAVALAADAGVLNGAVSWKFTTLPETPQLVGHDNRNSDLSADIELVFDRPVSLADASAISVRLADDDTPHPGITPVVDGHILRLEHTVTLDEDDVPIVDTFLPDEAYIITIAEGALTGDVNGLGNTLLRRVFFSGEYLLIDADFTNGQDGFQTAYQLGEITTTSPGQWRLSTSAAGPAEDFAFFTSSSRDENSEQDFLVSPLVNFTAGEDYVLRTIISTKRTMEVATSPTPDMNDLTVLSQLGTSFGGNGTRTVHFSPTASGPAHLVYYTPPTNPWQTQQIGSVNLRRLLDPVARITAPASGSTFAESEPIDIEIDAFGVSGTIANVRILDGDREIATGLTGEQGRYAFNWPTRAPGERIVTVEVTDIYGAVSIAELPLTITFDDGTLPDYIGWDFHDGLQGWSLTNASRISHYLRVNTNANNNEVSLSSPLVFLNQGDELTFEFKASRGSKDAKFGLVLADQQGFPSATLRAEREVGDVMISHSEWETYTLTFTAPEDGGYYLTLYAYQPQPVNNYVTAYFDDIRLIGSFNSAPAVAIQQPAGNVTTIAGADITFAVDASDSDGTVESVELIDAATGTRIAPDALITAAPWEYLWQDVPVGAYRVIARATDDSNGFTDSAERVLTVAENAFSIASYLGDAADDDAFTGAEYLPDGTLVLSAILDPGLFPGVTPLYLNGATAGDRGLIVRLSEDGRTVLSVSVVGPRVLDLSTDPAGRIFAAADTAGAVVLNASADSVLFSQSFPKRAHRIDAGADGTFAVLTASASDYASSQIASATAFAYAPGFALLGEMGGASFYTTDLAVDSATRTIAFIGWRNVSSMEDDTGSNPVDVPSLVGRAYDGTEKFRGYDWGRESEGERWLNRVKNNMADTRGARVVYGPDGKLYAAFEFDGGNTPLRDDPFDLDQSAMVVGGDMYHTMANTSTVPKVFVGRYEPETGQYLIGQWITGRLSNGNDNTIRIENGNLRVDAAGRIHVVGSSASGLPLTHDPLPGLPNTGGAYHLVYSPDFRSREFLTRLTLSTSGARTNNAGIAISPNGTIATAGLSASPFKFTVNAWQEELVSATDAVLAVGDLESFFKFKVADHPRLFFTTDDLPAIRDRLGREPFASMLQTLLDHIDSGDFFRPTAESDGRSVLMRARGHAKAYALTGDESHAASARDDVLLAFDLIGDSWASAATRGLDLYTWAKDLAIIYDLCAGSASWDAVINFQASRRLVDVATVIVESGGTQQPSDPGSNWQANRGASAGLALLATDHQFDPALAEAAHGRVVNYLNANAGFNAGSRGWNPEGFGYTAYPVGSFVGPYGVAAANDRPDRDLRASSRLQWKAWTGFAGATTALDVYGTGGVKTDWANDNAHVGGEGIYGLAFYYAEESFMGALRHAYDRFMGALSPLGPNWDAVRHGPFWSILYYPDDIAPQDPMENWDWHRASDDSSGLGVFTFRDGYAGAGDVLAQFKARRYTLGQANDGPDGLGFRIIGKGSPFVIGGGRASDAGRLNQPLVYPTNPDNDLPVNSNTGSVVGTPLVRPDGGGHAIAQMATNNVGTSSHKRWFVADYESSATGADAAFIVADTSVNGLFWQLPTFLDNTIEVSGDTFTITGTSGATLKGVILHPGGTPVITTGTKARGDGYTLSEGGTLATEDPVANPRVMENRYLHIEGTGDGAFLVVMTLKASGAHPHVQHLSGGVADAGIQVGGRTYQLDTDTVLYDGAPYAHPDATVTFDVGASGTITAGDAVQSVPYGAGPIEPTVVSADGFHFLGWDRAFERVVRDMTVYAIYMESSSDPDTFANWIASWGLALADQQLASNPDGDPFDNLTEYALGLDPGRPDGFDAITVERIGDNLVVTWRQSASAPNAAVTAMRSSTLGGWQPVDPAAIELVESTPTHVTYQATLPIGTDPVFVSLEIEYIE
jgi:hypothetical protein